MAVRRIASRRTASIARRRPPLRLGSISEIGMPAKRFRRLWTVGVGGHKRGRLTQGGVRQPGVRDPRAGTARWRFPSRFVMQLRDPGQVEAAHGVPAGQGRQMRWRRRQDDIGAANLGQCDSSRRGRRPQPRASGVCEPERPRMARYARPSQRPTPARGDAPPGLRSTVVRSVAGGDDEHTPAQRGQVGGVCVRVCPLDHPRRRTGR